MTPDVANARRVVTRSASVRAALRGKTPPDRDERLRACLDDLEAARAPLTALLRSGSHTGRRSRHRAERAASAAIQNERAKVRGMLRRASGGRRVREPYRFAQFKGYVLYATQQARVIDHDMRHALPQYGRGTREYREQAQAILSKLDHIQLKLKANRAKAQYWQLAGVWGKPTARQRAVVAQADDARDELRRLRSRAKAAVAVPLRVEIAGVRPTRPTGRRRRWTDEEAWEAFVKWTADHKRAPKAADLPGCSDLPSYAKTREMFGGLPEARQLLRDAGIT